MASEYQIERIHRLAPVLDTVPYDRGVSPYELQRKANVDRETVINYVHHAIFYQNFWPRLALDFRVGSKIEQIKIVKRSPPAGLSLFFSPDEAVMLKLLDHGAFDGREVKLSALQLTGAEKLSIRLLKSVKTGEKIKTDVSGDFVHLTDEGFSSALELMDRYSKFRRDAYADIRSVAQDLDTRAINDKFTSTLSSTDLQARRRLHEVTLYNSRSYVMEVRTK